MAIRQALHGGRRGLVISALGIAMFLQQAAPVAAFAGELDDTFDLNGKLAINIGSGADFFTDVVVQPSDQKIVAVGRGDPGDGAWAVVRLNTDGSLDSSFGGGDGVTLVNFSTDDNEYANAVALQGDGKIVIVGLAGGFGGQWGVARLTTDGQLDPAFSGDGKTTKNFTTGQDVGNDVAIQGDGKIVVTGSSAATDSKFNAVRINAGGGLDTTFSDDGVASTDMTHGSDIPNTVAIDTLGRIVLAGSVQGLGRQVGVARFATNGSVDGSFSGDGKVIRNLSPAADVIIASAIQPADNKVVLAGYYGGANSQFLVMRYNANGSQDNSFGGGDGRTTIDITIFTDDAYGLALQGDGKVVVAGTADNAFFALARLDADGARDASFGDDGVMFANLTADYDVALAAAIQADGSVVAVGGSSGSGGRMSAARFLGS